MENRIKKLVDELNYYNYMYYVNDVSKIDDISYDKKLRELFLLEEEHPHLKDKNSPTQRVGFKVSDGFEKAKLVYPMLSLSNTFNIEELKEFDDRVKKTLEVNEVEYCCEFKIDGLSIELVYNYGKLTRGSTRGDGEEGEDITNNLQAIFDIPLYIHELKEIEKFVVHGEVYMSKENFDRLNKKREEKGLKLMKNPRNCASGTLRQLDPNIVKERGLSLFLFNTGDAELLDLKTQEELLNKLNELKLPVNKEFRVFTGVEEIQKFIDEVNSLRSTLGYEIDGVVIKVNNIKQREKLGVTSKFPRWATAYKLVSETAVSRVLSVDMTVGRTGKITPTANLEPVALMGTTVARAQLHNQDIIDEKDIRIGDYVEVRKAGDIIPEVVRVLFEKRTGEEVKIVLPKICPHCGSETENVDGEVALRCVNVLCCSRVLEGIIHFASKKAMNIDGVGDKLITEMYNSDMVQNIADLYNLGPEDLYQLDRMGERSVSNILSAIEQSKGNSLERLLTGFGIPLVGERASKLIAKHFGSLADVVQANEYELSSIEGIGVKIAESIVDYFNNPSVLEVIEKLVEHDVNMYFIQEDVEKVTDTIFEGKTVVITGTLSSWKRDDLKKILENYGAKITGSITGKTDILICGEEAGSKLTKASELQAKGNPIIMLSEEELVQIIK